MATHSTRNRVPTHLDLMNPTLRALRRLGGSASIDEISREVTKDLGLPQSIVDTLHLTGPRTELDYGLAWARTHLKKYGLIDNSRRGIWSLTDVGLRTETVEASEVQFGVQRNNPDGRRAGSATEYPSDVIDPPTNDSEWQDELLDKLKTIEPAAFERLCQRVLRESGFIEVTVTRQSGDGGIDGNGVVRLAGLISFPVVFQCKRYNGNVGAGVVRDFRGAMQGRADKGMIITTGGFTSEASQEATRDGAPPIDLIDGQLLAEKMKELQLGVATRTVEVVKVDTAWFDSI